MLLKVDIYYPHLNHVGGEFPPSPATFLQAAVAHNGHRLGAVSDVLEAMETSACRRMVTYKETSSVDVRTYVPVLPQKKIRAFRYGDSDNKTEKDVRIFPLEDTPVHLSYYFELQTAFPESRLADALQVEALGRNTSVCFVKKVAAVTELPRTEEGIAWEPVGNSEVAYPGFLRNLILLHNARKSSRQAQPAPITFVRKDVIAPYAVLCYRLYDMDGEPFSYPRGAMSDIAAMMRHAVGKAVGKSEYVMGHSNVHPFYIPLPTVSKYRDDDIRRVVIAEPVQAAMLSRHLSSIASLDLLDDEDRFVCKAVCEMDANDAVFQAYLRPGRRFRTVTPISVDRTGNAARVGRRISTMLQLAGFTAPTSVTWSKAGWNGKLTAKSHGYLVHAEVEFDKPVAGPVACGKGMGYGIGLFTQIGAWF